ncbi:MAG TPA: hypothetical protein VNG51_00445 [Ktedonobacteraceae bacterium]|nr:hypothetical protein [Ktedonobacteraceae bacterium]
MRGVMITLYCGINEQHWNHHPVAPGPFACVAPVYGKTISTKVINRVTVPDGVQVMQDSGAFSDGPGQRLSCEAALERQRLHAETYGYASQITHRASYDVLIDEKWHEGRRYKARWTEQDADEAVDATVQAATYLAYHRDNVGLVLSAQGVSARQYLRCVERIVPLLGPQDMVGLGGWCITGKRPAQVMPVFRETLQAVIPFLGKEGVKRVHIWGVCYARALGELLWLCDEYGITLSTDSSGPSVRPSMGVWGYAEWRDTTYRQPPVAIRGLERARHVQATRSWLAHFRDTIHYHPPPQEPPRQLLLAL